MSFWKASDGNAFQFKSILTTKLNPSACAMVRSILDETVLLNMYTSLKSSPYRWRWTCRLHQPRRHPISLPVKTFHSPFLWKTFKLFLNNWSVHKLSTFSTHTFSATASLSASGSFAKIIVESLSLAVLIERSRALFPSSGFGNFTVGKSGSGSFCSSTAMKGWNHSSFHHLFSLSKDYGFRSLYRHQRYTKLIGGTVNWRSETYSKDYKFNQNIVIQKVLSPNFHLVIGKRLY